MSINQHGLMKNRLTITNLLEYASFVLYSIVDVNQIDSIHTDLSKAFDRVRHQLLLNEMSMGIELARCMWLGSYLSGRIHKIRIGVAVSKDIKVISGVPQGSHLGPFCFIWFVHKTSEIFDYVRVLFYADDMKLSRLFENSVGSEQTEWCDRNSLLINVGKCKTLPFARSRHPVKFSCMLVGTCSIE
jgi:hypothetical protein